MPPSSAAPSPPDSPAPAASSGAYGQEGLPAGVVDLFAAFLKTLPLAAKSDKTWLDLPPGPAGSVELTLTVDDEYRLAPIEIVELPSAPVPSQLKRALLINRNFLLRGKFALSQDASKEGPGGSQRLRLTARISKADPDPQTPEAAGVVRLGLLGGEHPRGAYFTFFSGRHVELLLEKLP